MVVPSVKITEIAAGAKRRTDNVMRHIMPTWKDVLTIAEKLPKVEADIWYGTPGLKVGGKGFARLRTEAGGSVVMLCTLEEKERLLESGEPAYFTEPHYDNFGAILIDLSKISKDALHELVVSAWRLKATPKIRALLTR